MITYKQDGDRVTLEMDANDYSRVLMLIGCATGLAFRAGEKEVGYWWVNFANDLNATNPNWTPYEIPPEFLTLKKQPQK